LVSGRSCLFALRKINVIDEEQFKAMVYQSIVDSYER